MGILAAYMVPHPPMIVPQVGRGSEKQIEKTIRAYEKVAAEITELRPETIILSSPCCTRIISIFPRGKVPRGTSAGSGRRRYTSGKCMIRS